MLSFYKDQSKISTPGKFKEIFDDLPDSISDLCEIVQNTFNHIFWIQKVENYGFTLKDIIEKGRNHSKELNLRTLEEKLELLFSLNDTPITLPRDKIDRVVGNCRDFSLMLVSMLRHKGIPARVRSGAGRYFYPLDLERYEDHYVCEYWSEENNRWIMVDPQLDELQRKVLKINFDTADIPYELFPDAGRTWRVFRKGNIDPHNFGIGDDWRGEVFVLNKLIMDLACLNKVEVLAWESWGICHDVKNLEKLGYEDFDELAEKISKVNSPEAFFELKNMFENDSRYKVPENYKPWFLEF